MPPIRSRICRKPVRVQLTPQPRDRQPRAGHEHAGGDQERGRRGIGGDRRTPRAASARRRCERVIASPWRSIRTLAWASSRSVWSRMGSARRRSSRRREQPGEQHAGLDLRAGDRQLVADPLQAPADDGERRQPAVARAISAPIWRSGSAIRSTGRRRIDSSPSSSNDAAGLSGEPAGQQPHQRAGVADVDRSVRVGRAAQAGSADHDLVGAMLDERAESLDGRQRRERVGGLEIAAHAHRHVGHRGEQRDAVRDRLVRGGRQRAAQRPARIDADLHETGMPSARISSLASSAWSLGDPQRHDAAAVVRRGAQRHVGDVDAGAAERRARCRRSTPGRFGTAARSSRTGPPASPASSSARRRSAAAALPGEQRRRGRRPSSAERISVRRAIDASSAAPQRLAVRAVDAGPELRSRARDARGVAEARAGRRHPLAAERPGGLLDEDVREHVRQMRDGGHRAVVVGRVDDLRDARRSPSGSRCTRSSSTPLVVGCGVRYQVAPSKRSSRACSTPETSAPASGWPPTKRSSVPGRGDDLALRRADVGHRAARRAPRRGPRG